MKSSILLLLLVLMFGKLRSQCPTANFDLPAIACATEEIELTNLSSDATAYYWDFCKTEFKESSIVSHVNSLNDAYRGAFCFDVLKAPAPAVLSLRANGILNYIPLTDDLTESSKPEPITGLTDAFSLPRAINAFTDIGNYYALVTNSRTGESMTLVNFGSSFSSVATFTRLDGIGVSGTNGLEVMREGNDFEVFAGQNSGNTIYHLTFPGSITATPSVRTFTVPGATSINHIKILKTCDGIIGVASSLNNNKLFLLIFPDGLSSVPATLEIVYTGEAIVEPAKFDVAFDNGEYFALVHTNLGMIHRLSFGNSLLNEPSSEKIWSGGVNGYDLQLIHHDNSWKSLFVDYSVTNRRLSLLRFNNNCDVSPSWSNETSPTLSIAAPGNYKITLHAMSASGFVSAIERNIVISEKTPAAIEFDSEGICSANEVEFLSNSDKSISAFKWDFGDGNSSELGNATHQFAGAGSFQISLVVTDVDGCTSKTSKMLKIYDAPVASFSDVTTLLCTNNSFLFPTTTPDIYDGNLSYQWFVDNNPVSTERDLEYTFTTNGPKEIKLKTSIPGCSNEITKTTSPVQPGPVVDFSFTGICEDEMFSFQNETSDAVESLTWDFGNGQTSTEINPSTYFNESGDFTVSLTATNTIGCENVSTKALSVRSVPMVDFTVNEPPNACSGVNTLLQNATVNPDGAAITEWLWDPGDGSAPVSQTTPDAQHVFANGGSYPVSLTAITEHGCVGTVDKTVIIEQAPATTFTFTPACDDIPVNFTGPGGDDISSLYWEIGTSYYDGPQPTHTFRSPGNYPVYLEVSGWNGCIATRERIIHVPEPLAPDFSVLRNCVGDEAILTDITDGVEPVLSSQWEFSNGNVFTSSPLLHSFHSPGSENVTLRVTTASGCVYAVTKPVQVLPQPVAAFSADPDNGAWPLIVSFTNTSSNATQYLWEFADGTGSTSSETSPVYTFLSTGTFPVKLTASNAQQCESNVIVNIPVIAPLPDADIALLTLSPNADGSLKLIATIHNKGNTVIRDLPMDIDLSGKLSLRHIVDGPILPGAKYNAVLGTDILNPQDLQYVCASIDLQNDLNPALNKACEELTAQLFIFPAYPNPVSGDLNLEWISRGQHLLTIRLTDAMGRYVYSAEIDGIAGFNHRVLDLSGIRNGVYVLSIGEGGSTRSERITILGKP